MAAKLMFASGTALPLAHVHSKAFGMQLRTWAHWRGGHMAAKLHQGFLPCSCSRSKSSLQQCAASLCSVLFGLTL